MFKDLIMKKTIIAVLTFLPATLLTGCVTETAYYDSDYNNTYISSGNSDLYYSGYNDIDYGLSTYVGGYYNRGWYGGGWRGR